MQNKMLGRFCDALWADSVRGSSITNQVSLTQGKLPAVIMWISVLGTASTPAPILLIRAADTLHVTLLLFLLGGIAYFDDFDREVQCLPGHWVVG